MGVTPYQQMGQPDPYAPYGYAPQYGSFWARLAAGLADGTLMFILLIFLVIVSSPLTGQETCVANEFGPDTCTVTDAAGLWSLLVLAVWLLITMVYFAWMWRASGQTLGMRVAKIKMVSDTDPSRTISTGRAVLRVVVRTGLNLMCLGWLGSFWMLWDSQSRTWQDMAAGSARHQGHRYAVPLRGRPGTGSGLRSAGFRSTGLLPANTTTGARAPGPPGAGAAPAAPATGFEPDPSAVGQG